MKKGWMHQINYIACIMLSVSAMLTVIFPTDLKCHEFTTGDGQNLFDCMKSSGYNSVLPFVMFSYIKDLCIYLII